MFVYKIKRLFGERRHYVKTRVSDKNKRRDQQIKKLKRVWFWHEDKWNQRHGINEG